jgi:hypothetical protein
MQKANMKRFVAAFTALALMGSGALEAVGARNAQYIGGTINGIQERAEGKIDTANETEMIFRAGKQDVRIPYSAIKELEYGQKAGRRVAMALLVSPWALFSKKRKHYFTITFEDSAGKEQAVVFELGKDIVRTTLKIVETRSGTDIQYQDEDARKSGVGGK